MPSHLLISALVVALLSIRAAPAFDYHLVGGLVGFGIFVTTCGLTHWKNIMEAHRELELDQRRLWERVKMESNWANKYALELGNRDRYGSPYVGGYNIAEKNGFGHDYEGSPSLHRCFD